MYFTTYQIYNHKNRKKVNYSPLRLVLTMLHNIVCNIGRSGADDLRLRREALAPALASSFEACVVAYNTVSLGPRSKMHETEA